MGRASLQDKQAKKMLEKQYNHAKKNEILDNLDIISLKEIIHDNPNLYLDELAFNFGVKTCKFVHYSIIRRCMVEKLNY